MRNADAKNLNLQRNILEKSLSVKSPLCSRVQEFIVPRIHLSHEARVRDSVPHIIF